MALALSGLPRSAPEGYLLDAPAAAVRLIREVARQPWTGLFVACDYGKTWAELIESTPGGTARAYHRHRLTADLLANPGEQDLTCHVCWDWLAEALVDCGFREPAVDFQESFFVHHAGAFLAAASEAGAGLFRPEKQSLMQLLHPSHLGQKFQVMWAWRG
jgi:SAM-dependent MidA family methyltransferase